MTGEEAAARIHARAWTHQAPGLGRTRTLLSRLGEPQRSLRFVHIAGSNGKGSTAAMLASILRAAGYRTGLFTSPHLVRFNERICVDGTPITDEVLVRQTQRLLTAAEGMEEGPTEFELMTALGMLCFAEAGCDLVVLEVGLGGRLDSTNVIDAPEVCVITNIGLEHTQLLGSTVAQIAREKGGILKSGSRAVLYAQSREAENVIEELCREQDIPLARIEPDALTLLEAGPEGQRFTYRGRGPYQLSLIGGYQLRNAMTVLDTVDTLRAAGWSIGDDAVAAGLADARWPARLELVRRAPDLLIDGAHNPQCAGALMDALAALYPGKKLIFLAGVLSDKDWRAMFTFALPMAGAFVLVPPPGSRALSTDEPARWLEERGVRVLCRETPKEALEAALTLAAPTDTVCAWGSLYLAGELRHLLGLA